MSRKKNKGKLSIIEPTFSGTIVYIILSTAIVVANSNSDLQKINIHLSNAVNDSINYLSAIVFVLFIVSAVYLVVFEMIRLVEDLEYGWSIRKRFKKMSASRIEKMLVHKTMRFASKCIIAAAIVLYVFKVAIPLISGTAVNHLFADALLVRALQFILIFLACHGLTVLLRLLIFRNRLALAI